MEPRDKKNIESEVDRGKIVKDALHFVDIIDEQFPAEYPWELNDRLKNPEVTDHGTGLEP